MSLPLWVKVISQEKQRVALEVAGDLDMATAVVLEQALDALDDRDVVLRLADLRFLDSSGMRVLVAFHRGQEESGRRLTIRECSGTCARALEVAGLTDVLHLEP